MRATGIVRRIDDLGRIVIPKEIRKTLRIREGDPLEIFTARDGEIILKKYSPIGELDKFAQEYAETLSELLGFEIIVTDSDSIIATTKTLKNEYKNKAISSEIERYIDSREIKGHKDSQLVPIHKEDSMNYNHQIIVPIVSSAKDSIGAMIMVSNKEEALTDKEESILKVAANFLGKQV